MNAHHPLQRRAAQRLRWRGGGRFFPGALGGHQGACVWNDSANATAVSIALALFTVSWNSPSGVESFTQPPPDCTYAFPSFNSAVRIVMQQSKFPLNEK